MPTAYDRSVGNDEGSSLHKGDQCVANRQSGRYPNRQSPALCLTTLPFPAWCPATCHAISILLQNSSYYSLIIWFYCISIPCATKVRLFLGRYNSYALKRHFDILRIVSHRNASFYLHALACLAQDIFNIVSCHPFQNRRSSGTICIVSSGYIPQKKDKTLFQQLYRLPWFSTKAMPYPRLLGRDSFHTQQFFHCFHAVDNQRQTDFSDNFTCSLNTANWSSIRAFANYQPRLSYRHKLLSLQLLLKKVQLLTDIALSPPKDEYQ